MATYQSLASGSSPFGASTSNCNNDHISISKSREICSSVFQQNKYFSKHTSSQRPSSNAFEDLQREITNLLESNNPSPLSKLRSLLEGYSSDSAHWSLFAHAEPTKQYTRNLVCEVPGVFNLLLLVWTPGKASPVHDHADSHCLMKILKGDLRERRYAIPSKPGHEGPLVKISDLNYGFNQVAYMADQLGVHDISNPSQTEYAVSLHLYFPPNAALKGCHVYDLENGGARHVIQGLYDTVKGVPATKK